MFGRFGLRFSASQCGTVRSAGSVGYSVMKSVLVLRVTNVAIGYGGEPVVEGIDLEVRAGEFVSLLGPSGSGKSSLLRVITGLTPPMRGDVTLEVVPNDVGLLFQDDALLPWRTALQNVALGLTIRGVSPDAARAHATEWLAMMGMAGFSDRYPRQLSGGQRKRVALAQVFALKPKLLLMDEPFASLDAIVRTRITEDLLGWVEREHVTVLLVTHDIEEAIALSDAVYVLSQGPRARIKSRRKVEIERPRHVLASRQNPHFAALVQQLWADLDGARSPAREGAP
jgi:NitT/TauT family transport system ATP-binding protein